MYTPCLPQAPDIRGTTTSPLFVTEFAILDSAAGHIEPELITAIPYQQAVRTMHHFYPSVYIALSLKVECTHNRISRLLSRYRSIIAQTLDQHTTPQFKNYSTPTLTLAHRASIQYHFSRLHLSLDELGKSNEPISDKGLGQTADGVVKDEDYGRIDGWINCLLFSCSVLLLVAFRLKKARRRKWMALSISSRHWRGRSVVSALLFLTLIASPAIGSNGCENLPREFANLFMSALDALEVRVTDEVDTAFDEIGLGPFGNSLLVRNLIDFKAGLFEELFGTKDERTKWINGTTVSAIDIYNELNANVADVIGNAILDITCVFSDTDGDAVNDKYMVDLTVRGSIPSPASLEPTITLLPPQSFPSLGLDVSAINVVYELHMPLTLYRGLNKIFLLGETQAVLALDLSASISESLPILSNKNITFSGDFDFGASLSYSSIQGLSSSGTFNAILDAKVANKYVGVRAHDDDIFDTIPRT